MLPPRSPDGPTARRGRPGAVETPADEPGLAAVRVLPSRRPEAPPPPAAFSVAVASLHRVVPRSEAVVRRTSPPVRIAPFAEAIELDVGDEASGRLVYLHDPAGQQAWDGCDRLVGFARAEIDTSMARDALLSDVVWSWLTDALPVDVLDRLGGTVTTTVSRRFGSLAGLAPADEVELRCSWTPVAAPGADLDLGPHLEGFLATLAAMTGLPPVVDVAQLPTGPDA